MAKRERICLAVSLLLCHVTICHNEGVTLRQRQTKAGTLEFTHGEYARLQTFPDDWVFYGKNQREIQLQIGNAVPVVFAKKIAQSVREALEVLDGVRKPQTQLCLFPDFF